MGKHHRVLPPDTIDAAIRHLMGLQADGWGLTHLETRIDYQPIGGNAQPLPTEATITVVLRPARG